VGTAAAAGRVRQGARRGARPDAAGWRGLAALRAGHPGAGGAGAARLLRRAPLRRVALCGHARRPQAAPAHPARPLLPRARLRPPLARRHGRVGCAVCIT